MKKWCNPLLVKALKNRQSSTNVILHILEEHSDGLPVMAILRLLGTNGFNITQQAVSKNLGDLEKKGRVWKIRRLNEESKRELWHYKSSIPFFDSIAEDIRKEVILVVSKSIQKNIEKAPKFEDFQIFQSFLENVILHAAESAICDEELYSELSKRKPYGECAVLIRKYTEAVSTIQKAIEINPQLRGVVERRINLNLPSSLTLSNRYDIARAIVDGSIKGEKRYFHSIDFLLKNTTGDLSEKLAESLVWIQSRSGLPAKGDEKDE